MAFAPTSSRQDALSRPDMTPLVGVLLAVLAIFMLAMPLSSRPVPLDIVGGCRWGTEAPEPIRVRIDASNGVFVNDQSTRMSALHAVFAAAVQAEAGNHGPSLRMDINDDADYQTVAQVIATGLDAGLVGVDFVKR